MKRIIKLILLCVFFAGLPAQGQNLPWQSYDQGLYQAQQQKKLLLIQFYDKNCHYCHEMEDALMQNTTLRQLWQKSFVPVRVNQKSERLLQFEKTMLPEKHLFTRYGVFGPPTLIILRSDGKVIVKVAGMLTPPQLTLLLSYVSSGAYQHIKMETYRQQQGL